PLDSSIPHDPHNIPSLSLTKRRFRNGDTSVLSRGLGAILASALKGRLHPHVRQDARIEFLETHAYLDRGLLPVGSRDDGDDLGRDLPLWIRIQRGLDWLAGFDAVDVALAHVHLDLE